MGTQKAGDSNSKPGIHISDQDARIARELEVEDKSPSTVYSDALEKWYGFEQLRERKRKELRRAAVELRQEAEEWGFQLVGDIL